MGCIAYFFLTVTFFSISEVSLLLYVAGRTGIAFTMFCCIFTGIVGGYFVRSQGLATLAKIKKSLGLGQIPADETVEALLLLIVGILLCVPGFITDASGFLIIIPGIRKIVAAKLVNRFRSGIDSGQFKVYSQFSGSGSHDENKMYEDFADQSKNQVENATIVEVVKEDEEKDDAQ